FALSTKDGGIWSEPESQSAWLNTPLIWHGATACEVTTPFSWHRPPHGSRPSDGTSLSALSTRSYARQRELSASSYFQQTFRSGGKPFDPEATASCGGCTPVATVSTESWTARVKFREMMS